MCFAALCSISLSTISYMLQLRREKISDRMKSLQDLVPNSNKVHFFGCLTCLVHFHKLQLQLLKLVIELIIKTLLLIYVMGTCVS